MPSGVLAGSISAAAWGPVLAALLTAAVGALSAWQLAALKHRREAADKATQALRHNRDPLLRAVFDLQSRLYNIVALEFFERYWRDGDKEARNYTRASTLWLFGQYLGWTEILRREVQYLDIGSRATNREVQRRLNDVAAAMASDSYGRENTFILFRSDQRAVGEFMVTERDTQNGKTPDCLGYTEFVAELARMDAEPAEGQLETPGSPVPCWSRRFAAEIEAVAATGVTSELKTRLVRVQRRLVNLLDLLDSERLRYPNPDLRGRLPWTETDKKPLPRQVAKFVCPPGDVWSGVDDWARSHRLRCTSTSATKRCYCGRFGPLGGRPKFDLILQRGMFTICAWTEVARKRKRVDGSLRSRRARLSLDELLDLYDRPLVVGASRPFRGVEWFRGRARALAELWRGEPARPQD